MFWSALALAVQLSLPTSVDWRTRDIRQIFRVDDFPEYLQRAGVSRTVYTATTVRVDGTIQGCIAEVGSGDAKLDAYTCGLIVKRAKLAPARWTDGSPVYGVIRVPVSWRISDGIPSAEDGLKAIVPDLELSANRLPKGAHSIVLVALEIAADENGRPLTCAENPTLADMDPRRHFPELNGIACQQVMTSLTVHPPVDGSGKAVRSVQSISVHFKLDH